MKQSPFIAHWGHNLVQGDGGFGRLITHFRYCPVCNLSVKVTVSGPPAGLANGPEIHKRCGSKLYRDKTTYMIERQKEKLNVIPGSSREVCSS